jgi:signal transduction histidine kinase
LNPGHRKGPATGADQPSASSSRGWRSLNAHREAILGKQGRHLSDLVSKLRDLGAIGSGRLKLARDDVDLAEVVSRCVKVREASRELLDRSGSVLALEPVRGR